MPELQNPNDPTFMSQLEKELTYDPVIASCRSYLKATGEEKVKISEDTFIKELLPMLAGEETDVDLSFWFHKAGSYLKPIWVYKGDQELFMVPPFFNRDAVQTKDRVDDFDSLAADIDLYVKKMGINKSEANRYLHQAFETRMKNTVDYAAEAAHINGILARYGKPTIGAIPGAAITPEGKPVNESDFNPDDFDSGGLD